MLTMSHTDPCFTSTLCCPRRTYEAGLCQTHSRGTAVPSRWLVHLLLPAGTLQGVLSSKRPGSEVKRTLKPPHPSDQSLKAPDPPVSKSLPEPPDFDFPHLCKVPTCYHDLRFSASLMRTPYSHTMSMIVHLCLYPLSDPEGWIPANLSNGNWDYPSILLTHCSWIFLCRQRTNHTTPASTTTASTISPSKTGATKGGDDL
ncbi:uncharacterized protein LOC120784426 isoform X2 [Xiphias gladius]|uniref:uncharacterized protein LOC120784426 isoform X2 n=1 Tax=Xiphias gladius TaxID=8245 RepID=UPI001A98D06E|nr:uncharacterized protein LOC120784426 isoform X2 [Xiphias gladius]